MMILSPELITERLLELRVKRDTVSMITGIPPKRQPEPATRHASRSVKLDGLIRDIVARHKERGEPIESVETANLRNYWLQIETAAEIYSLSYLDVYKKEPTTEHVCGACIIQTISVLETSGIVKHLYPELVAQVLLMLNPSGVESDWHSAKVRGASALSHYRRMHPTVRRIVCPNCGRRTLRILDPDYMMLNRCPGCAGWVTMEPPEDQHQCDHDSQLAHTTVAPLAMAWTVQYNKMIVPAQIYRQLSPNGRKNSHSRVCKSYETDVRNERARFYRAMKCQWLPSTVSGLYFSPLESNDRIEKEIRRHNSKLQEIAKKYQHKVQKAAQKYSLSDALLCDLLESMQPHLHFETNTVNTPSESEVNLHHIQKTAHKALNHVREKPDCRRRIQKLKVLASEIRPLRTLSTALNSDWCTISDEILNAESKIEQV